MRSIWFVLVFLGSTLFRCVVSTGELVEVSNGHKQFISAVATPTRVGAKRGARFLGLLGLLTGLTLVDSLEDESDRPRRSGFVKIDVGRPASFDGFYGGYGYTGGPPYWSGGSSINIKIPFRPGGGGDFETMALFPFPVPYPSGPGGFGSFSPHGNEPPLEPRPSIFADPIPSGSSGSGTVLADEGEQSTRKNKGKRGSARTKVSPPRTIRSTLRADGDEMIDDDVEETSAAALDTTTELLVIEDQPATDLPPPANTTNETNSLIDTPSEGLTAQPVSLASIVQDVNYVTQPSSPYQSYPNSLADVSAIELTTDDRAEFQPSRSDHWQDFYSSVSHVRDHHHHPHQRDFLPIATVPAY
ncbi:uncharacterized protein LOC131285907 [Anopheles ziemanni]|uniref:uncharacterized protein LOC131269859 n=1 Tax=Anopheles coustani TaxID=139045 RepID=UPI00265811B5|nr:uncharacterized protein LOC131269859 [Anopheles coustani]XP_058170743.1 uncharacterized protein LOC131285907 [Anopheles ziemanni]